MNAKKMLANVWIYESRILPIELSHQLAPSAQIDGFDISSAQFPIGEWLPRNVHLYVQDAFSRFPRECIGMYDVVHVRYFVTVVCGRNVEGMMRNLGSLLSE